MIWMAALALCGPSNAADHSIASYGAVAGGGDDLPAIHAAFAAAGPGDRVVIPAGRFQISAPIVPKADVTLAGVDREVSVIEYIGSSSNPMMRIQTAGMNRVELTGFTLDGLGTSQATQGIETSGTSGHHIHRIRVRGLIDSSGFGPHGIYASGGVTDCLIEDNEFLDIGVASEWGAGIRLNGGSNRNVVRNNLIQNVGRGGILLRASTDCEIRGNTVNKSGQTGPGLGIELWSGSDRGIVEDNVVDHWLSIDSSDMVAVRRNTVSATDGSLQFLGLELGGGEDCIFTANTVGPGNHIGFSMSNNTPKRRVYIAGNVFTKSETWGAQLQDDQGEIRQVYFFDNVFERSVGADPNLYGAPAVGFRFNAVNNGAGIRQVVFDTNRIINNDHHGFALYGHLETEGIDELSFVGNTITNNGGDAIQNTGGMPNIEWTGNTVSGNGNNYTPATTGFAENAKPTVAVVAPARAVVGHPVFLEIQYADDGASTPAEVLWDLTAGLPVNDQSPTHVFEQVGTHTLSVVAWDEQGRAGHAQHVIEILPPQGQPGVTDFLITDFGALAGGGDDLAAIHAAFAEAGPGHRVVIPAGRFQISAPIVPKADVTLAGVDREVSVIEYMGASSNPMMRIQTAGMDRVELTGFTLDGRGASKATLGIEISGTGGHHIHGLRVRGLVDGSGFGPHGIYGSGGVTDCLIEDNEFLDIGVASEWGAGIRLNGGSNRNVVRSNLIQNVGRGGILLSTSTDCEIRENILYVNNDTVKNDTAYPADYGTFDEAFAACRRCGGGYDHVGGFDNELR